MASYLATVAIGRFRVDRLVHGSGMVVTTAVDASLGRFVDRQLQRTDDVFRFLRREIGAYPFEAVGGIVDVVPVGFALETQTIPVYSDLFFFRGRDSSWVIAHELAHQWFGDSVSLRRWRDIWLNEGFATYFEWVWTAEQRESTAYRIAARLYDQIDARDRFWDVVIGDPGPRKLFHPAVYYRGAMAVAQLEHRLGGQRFDRLVTRWIARYRNSDATTRDFVRLAEDTCGCGSLDRLFDQWLYTPGRPRWR
jgi:aminopeptidase N